MYSNNSLVWCERLLYPAEWAEAQAAARQREREQQLASGGSGSGDGTVAGRLFARVKHALHMD